MKMEIKYQINNKNFGKNRDKLLQKQNYRYKNYDEIHRSYVELKKD